MNFTTVSKNCSYHFRTAGHSTLIDSHTGSRQGDLRRQHRFDRVRCHSGLQLEYKLISHILNGNSSIQLQKNPKKKHMINHLICFTALIIQAAKFYIYYFYFFYKVYHRKLSHINSWVKFHSRWHCPDISGRRCHQSYYSGYCTCMSLCRHSMLTSQIMMRQKQYSGYHS